MELRQIGKDSADKALLESINEEAIPENERISLDDMIDTGAEVFGIYRGREPAGYFIIRSYRNVIYLAFLAVRKDLRSGGLGGEAVRALISRFPDRQIVVEYEAPEKNSTPDDIRVRRKGFYRRNGFHETGWHTCYDGMEFEIGCSGPDFDAEGFAAFAEHLASFISDHIPRPFKVSNFEEDATPELPESGW